MSPRSDAIVIGGGQAGLAVSHELTARAIDHVVLERQRVGASWAGLWDAFRLNTPRWSVDLPGMPYDGADPEGFMSRNEIVAHLVRYADAIEAPILEGVEVTSLVAADDEIALATSQGPMSARCVVVCTGAYQRPRAPAWRDDVPARVALVDATTYRHPRALPDGDVLVVGGGQTGMQVAEDLRAAGRDVTLACGKAPWAPRRTAGRDLLWWAIETGFLEQTVHDLPTPAARVTANVTASGVDGGHDLHARVLRAEGVTLAGRVVGVGHGRIELADDLGESVAWSDARYGEFRRDARALSEARGLGALDLADPGPFDPTAPDSVELARLGAVVVAGGFRPDYGWIRVPGIVDEMGFPRQTDGASAVDRRIAFAGVHFLRRRRSSLLCGVGDDAAVVADGVVATLGEEG